MQSGEKVGAGSKLPPQQSEQLGARGSLRQSFSSLIDSMRFAYGKDGLEKQVQELQNRTARGGAELDLLNQKLLDTIVSAGSDVDPQNLLDLASQIGGFAKMAIEQTKEKMVKKASADLSDEQARFSSEETKLRKSLEAFLVSSPFQVMDKVVNVKLVDGAYEARASYTCAENVRYEYSYDTKASKVLGKEFRLSTFEKDFKVAVSLGKNWLRRDQVPDLERVDQYVLASAEASESHLIAIFRHQEKNSNLKIVCSKVDSHSSLSVEYSDDQKTVDITGTPSLNKFLDAEPVESTMERLWLAIIELDPFRAQLTKLVSDGRDVLERLEAFDFLAKSWRVISSRILEELKKSGGKGSPEDDEGGLSENYVREKISSLGDNSATLLQDLKLAPTP